MEERHPEMNYCQSCAMPLVNTDDYGTNIDGTKNIEYCKYCYQNGHFIEPEITVREMITKTTEVMKEMHIPAEQIEETRKFIPMLKRWRR